MSKKPIELLTRDPLHEVLDYCSDQDVLALGCTSQLFKTKVNDRQLWVRRAKDANIEFLPDDPLEAKLYYLAIKKMQRCLQGIPQNQFEVVLKHKNHPFTMRCLVYYYMNFGIPNMNSSFFEELVFEPYRALEIATDLANKFRDIRGLLFLVDCCVNNDIMISFIPKNKEILNEWPMPLINLAFKLSGKAEPNLPYIQDTKKIYQAISKESFYKFFQQHSFEELIQYSKVLKLIGPRIICPERSLISLAEKHTLREISDSINFLVAAVISPREFINLLSVSSLDEIKDINEEIKSDIQLRGFHRVIKGFHHPKELVTCTDYSRII